MNDELGVPKYTTRDLIMMGLGETFAYRYKRAIEEAIYELQMTITPDVADTILNRVIDSIERDCINLDIKDENGEPPGYNPAGKH